MRGLRIIPAAALLAACALSGCEAPGIDSGAARELQGQVAEVAEAAAAGDYEAALEDLTGLSARLETAARHGEVSERRQERISAAIETVRLNLQTELALQK
ncbi:hypothetical protein ACIQXM_02445 [Arthrobacter sp. NPDC097144]|uniref:hypothetical protein n=1 Tax=Arthrobacter sp. NPDC097144 TaxID=3363946 RepID=UPI003826E5F1